MSDVRVLHPWRWFSGIVIVVLIVVIGYTGWLLWTASHNLKAASDDAHALKAAALGNKPSQVSDALDDFSTHVHKARSATDSPMWSVLDHLPGFGDDARGVRTVSRVGDDLAGHGLTELAGALGDIDGVLPQNGSIDAAKLASLVKPVDQGDSALTKASDALATQDPSGYVGPLKDRYRDLQQQVDDAAEAMGVADKALQVMPQMLGADSPKNYLLIMQNNAEVRSHGGLPGAVGLLHAENGRISLVRETSGASFGKAPAPVLPLQAAEKKLYSNNLGSYFLDAGLTPDFPRSADFWKARWEQTQPEKVDGVIELDTVSLSYLLKATGPVTVDGVRLTSDNAVSELLSKVYVRLPNPADQDVFFGKVASAVFQKVATFTGSRQQLLTSLHDATDQGRLLVHSFDPSVQAKLTDTEIAGQLNPTKPTKNPQVGVYFADGTLSKMSYYLLYDTQVKATSCTGGVQSMTGSMTLTSKAPADAKTSLPSYVTGTHLPPSQRGNMLVAVNVFLPSGGTATKLTGKDMEFPQYRAVLDGRPVIATWVLLKPGQSQELHWTMKSGKGQTGDTSLAVTPSIVPGSKSSVVPSACS